MTIYAELMAEAAEWPHDEYSDVTDMADRGMLVLTRCKVNCYPCQLKALAKRVCAEAQIQQLSAIDYAVKFLKDTYERTSSRSLGECEHAIKWLEQARDIIGGPK